MSHGDNPSLTAVRGIAAFWVFVYHAWVAAGPQLLVVTIASLAIDLTPLASCGWAGVDIFYVLSGFLLWGLFDDWAAGRKDHLPLYRYAERRALRILPPYYGQLVLLALLGFATNLVTRPTPPDILWHLTVLHGWSWTYWQTLNGVWWTLSVEMQFYVTLPFLAWLVRRIGWWRTLALGYSVMLAWRMGAFVWAIEGSVPYRVFLLEQFPGHIDQFLCGMLAQHLARAPEGRAARMRDAVLASPMLRRLALLTGPVVLIALAYRLHVGDFYLRYWEGHAWLYFWHALAAVAIAITLYALAVRESAPPRSAWQRFVGWSLVGFGTISYSFYLWHELLLRWIAPRIVAATGGPATMPSLVVMFATGFLVATLAAAAWYLLLERPFLRTRARLRDTEGAAPAASTSLP